VQKYEQKKNEIFVCELDVFRQGKSDICYISDDVRQSDTAETWKRQKKVDD